MIELLAQGGETAQRWRQSLTVGHRWNLGRASAADLPVPWDQFVSQHHADLVVEADGLHVVRTAVAKNPIFFRGDAVSECRVPTGEHFVIGSTAFYVLRRETDSATDSPAVEEVTFQPQQLRKVRYQDPENRIEVLTHLPEVIAGARDEGELFHRLANLLLRGVVHAEAVAVISAAKGEPPRVLHWERRRETDGEPSISRRLVVEALENRRSSVLHRWEADDEQDTLHTMAPGFDWAFCTPVPGLLNGPAGLYVAGRMGKTFVPGTTLSDQGELEADVKFTELVAEIISAVWRARRLERQKAGLRQFFAPPVLSALGDHLDTSLLEPRECDVTVMFCDLRGFSQRMENHANDLIGLLERVSRALGVMTQQILQHGGVTGDFQGDATLGFWGWPFASPDAAVQAARAALGIRAAFSKAAAQKTNPLADFAMGIGLAHGRAVAGKIGTAEQVKVTVFGPVVNLASRLEGMTKQLRVPILLDAPTAHLVRQRMPTAEGRTRRLARVLPYGMETTVDVFELVPPVEESPGLTDSLLIEFEEGVTAFIEGRWEDAYRALHAMPAADRAQDFLLQQITARGRVAPPDWDGVVRLPSK